MILFLNNKAMNIFHNKIVWNLKEKHLENLLIHSWNLIKKIMNSLRENCSKYLAAINKVAFTNECPRPIRKTIFIYLISIKINKECIKLPLSARIRMIVMKNKVKSMSIKII